MHGHMSVKHWKSIWNYPDTESARNTWYCTLHLRELHFIYSKKKTLTALTEKVGSIGDACGLYLGRARFECRQRHANVTSGSRGCNQYIQVRSEITLRTLPCRFSNSLFATHTSTGRCVIRDTGMIL